jgi:hypothetical protein
MLMEPNLVSEIFTSVKGMERSRSAEPLRWPEWYVKFPLVPTLIQGFDLLVDTLDYHKLQSHEEWYCRLGHEVSSLPSRTR